MKVLRHLYAQVLIGVFLGIALGIAKPEWATAMKPAGDAFIALLKMMIAPIVFTTVVLGIGTSGSLRKAGRVGLKALLYFEAISTLALLIGLVSVNLLKPGRGFNIDPRTLDASAVGTYAKQAQELSLSEYFMGLIPKTFFDPLTHSGDLLPLLLVAVLFGYALNRMGPKGEPIRALLAATSDLLNRIVRLLTRLAPIGAFGAMAFTIGKYGIHSFGPLLSLMFTFYLTCIVFVVAVLGVVTRLNGFGIFRFLHYIRDELFTVLGTSSSETVLVPLMEKLEKLGCSKSVVGLVVPTGYSFNLDGTNIYLTLAALFIAQALNIDLTLTQQITLLLVAMLISKGASGVTGAGFITLAATLAVVPSIPVAGLALILGIDRFMSEARALTNTVGNGVAGIVVSRWEGELDGARLRRELRID
jgi:aerobic C4-dicarboxylate transport protein